MTDETRELLRLVRFFGAFEREAVCCGSVTVPQCLVLQELLEGDRLVSQLASASGGTPSAMTRLIDGLVQKGLLSRERGEADRRQVVVSLTDEGRAEAQRLRALTDAGIQQVLACIPRGKRAAVRTALSLLADACEQAAAKGLRCCGPG